jgi:Fic family protein
VHPGWTSEKEKNIIDPGLGQEPPSRLAERRSSGQCHPERTPDQMSYPVLTNKERSELAELSFHLRTLGGDFPLAREEAMTALRCLKAVHSNSIEDKAVDRVFLQVLLHGAGVPDKMQISRRYGSASLELKGQEALLVSLESKAKRRVPLSLSEFQEMHRMIFEASNPEMAGKFRMDEVRISGMKHRPPHPKNVPEALLQHVEGLNEDLFQINPEDEFSFLEVLRVSARVHYLIAFVHPFEDGNGRVARAAGDYAMLVHGLYYDVIMTDYRDVYLDALESSTWADTTPLFHFLEYSYLETLRRISGFFQLVGR